MRKILYEVLGLGGKISIKKDQVSMPQKLVTGHSLPGTGGKPNTNRILYLRGFQSVHLQDKHLEQLAQGKLHPEEAPLKLHGRHSKWGGLWAPQQDMERN